MSGGGVLVEEAVGKQGIIYLSWCHSIWEGWKAVWLATCQKAFGSPNALGF